MNPVTLFGVIELVIWWSVIGEVECNFKGVEDPASPPQCLHFSTKLLHLSAFHQQGQSEKLANYVRSTSGSTWGFNAANGMVSVKIMPRCLPSFFLLSCFFRRSHRLNTQRDMVTFVCILVSHEMYVYLQWYAINTDNMSVVLLRKCIRVHINALSSALMMEKWLLQPSRKLDLFTRSGTNTRLLTTLLLQLVELTPWNPQKPS